MREATANRIEQLIKQHMPVGAVAYFFQQVTADNRVIRFPETGFFKLIAPFEFPVGVPSGTYHVFFVRSPADPHPLPPRDPEYPYPEVAFYFAPSPANPPVPPEAARPTRSRFRPDEKVPSNSLREERREYAKQRMSVNHMHEEQNLEKSKHYTQEVCEVFTLNQSYRQELADSAKLLMTHPKQLAEDMKTVSTMFRQMTESSLEMTALLHKRLAESANPPPPPPPAYITVMQTLMPLVVPLGVAAFASLDLASRVPPELMKVLVASLAALTPPAPAVALPKKPTDPVLPAMQQPSINQPEPHGTAETADHDRPSNPIVEAAAAPRTSSEAAATEDCSLLPPLADGTLTVKGLEVALAALNHSEASPELKQFLATWTSIADQLIPERAARDQNIAAPLTADALSVKDLHRVLSICEQVDGPAAKKMLAIWLSIANGVASNSPARSEDAPAPPVATAPPPPPGTPSPQAAQSLPTGETAPSPPAIHSLQAQEPASSIDGGNANSSVPDPGGNLTRD